MNRVYMTPASVRQASRSLRRISTTAGALDDGLYVRHLLPGDNGELPPAILEYLRDVFERTRADLATMNRELRADATEFDRRAQVVEDDIRQAKREFLRPSKRDSSIWGTIKNLGEKLWNWIRNLGTRGFKFVILDDLMSLVDREYAYVNGRWVVRRKDVSLTTKVAILAAWAIPIPGGRLIGKAGKALVESLIKVFKTGFQKAIKLLDDGKASAAVKAIKDGLEKVLKSAKGLALTVEGRRILAQRQLGVMVRNRQSMKKLDDILARRNADGLSPDDVLAMKSATANAVTSTISHLSSGDITMTLFGLLSLRNVSVAGRRAALPDVQEKVLFASFSSSVHSARQTTATNLMMGAGNIYLAANSTMETAESLHGKVSVELLKYKNQLTDAAYRNMQAWIDWFYRNGRGAPPIGGGGMADDMSAENLFRSMGASMESDLRTKAAA